MSEIIKYKLRFLGGEADYHRLPAHEGAVSLEGITWAVSLVTNYAVSGEIRARGSLSPKFTVYLQPARQGSYVTDLWIYLNEPNNLFMTSIIGSYAISTVSQSINALIVSTFREVCGLTSTLVRKEMKWLDRLPSGDREALIDRIEPPMTRAHKVIGEGANSVGLIKGPTKLIQMDMSTKIYLEETITEGPRISLLGVGAYNANTGNGRIYDPDVGKTIPFFVPKGKDTSVYSALTYSLDRYVKDMDSLIRVTYMEKKATDGRVKHITITHAEKISNRDLFS